MNMHSLPLGGAPSIIHAWRMFFPLSPASEKQYLPFVAGGGGGAGASGEPGAAGDGAPGGVSAGGALGPFSPRGLHGPFPTLPSPPCGKSPSRRSVDTRSERSPRRSFRRHLRVPRARLESPFMPPVRRLRRLSAPRAAQTFTPELGHQRGGARPQPRGGGGASGPSHPTAGAAGGGRGTANSRGAAAEKTMTARAKGPEGPCLSPRGGFTPPPGEGAGTPPRCWQRRTVPASPGGHIPVAPDPPEAASALWVRGAR